MLEQFFFPENFFKITAFVTSSIRIFTHSEISSAPDIQGRRIFLSRGSHPKGLGLLYFSRKHRKMTPLFKIKLSATKKLIVFNPAPSLAESLAERGLGAGINYEISRASRTPIEEEEFPASQFFSRPK